MKTEMVSLKQAAAELSVSRKTIRRRIADKEIKAIKVGRIFRIDRRELEKFLERSAT